MIKRPKKAAKLTPTKPLWKPLRQYGHRSGHDRRGQRVQSEAFYARMRQPGKTQSFRGFRAELVLTPAIEVTDGAIVRAREFVNRDPEN